MSKEWPSPHNTPPGTTDWEVWRQLLDPFCEDGWIEGLKSEPMKAQLEWYEKEFMNEATLYPALGKDNARSVLRIWRDFKWMLANVRIHSDTARAKKAASD